MDNSAMPPPPPEIQFKDLTRNDTYGPLVCLAPMTVAGGGIWSGGKPLNNSIPLFLCQLTIIVFVTRATDVVLRPFRSPRYISNVLVGSFILLVLIHARMHGLSLLYITSSSNHAWLCCCRADCCWVRRAWGTQRCSRMYCFRSEA